MYVGFRILDQCMLYHCRECTVPKQSHRTGICVFVIDRTLSFQSECTPDQICCGDPLYVLWTLINKFLKPIVDIDKRHPVSESGFRRGEKTIKIKPVSSIEYYKYSTHRILNWPIFPIGIWSYIHTLMLTRGPQIHRSISSAV